MPAKRAVTEKEFFKNAQTWKQISTNVPPRMLEVLKSRVTPTFTMSHLLREIIAESALMRYGHLPQPSWCLELTDQVAALREEIAAEKVARVGAQNALTELKEEIAELRKEVSQPDERPMTVRQERYEQRARMVARLQQARIYDESDRESKRHDTTNPQYLQRNLSIVSSTESSPSRAFRLYPVCFQNPPVRPHASFWHLHGRSTTTSSDRATYWASEFTCGTATI